MNSLITNETTTIGSKNHDNNRHNDTDDTTSTRLTTPTIHSYPMIPIDSVLLIDTWWIALELWYNYTDRYIDAIDVWMNAIQENNNDDDDDDMKNSTETTITIDCENGNVSYEKYGMDHLEYEWRKTQERFIQQQDHDDQVRIYHQQHIQISYIQLYIFIAGTLLDAQRYRKARQFLFTAIIHLLSLMLIQQEQQRLCTSNKNNSENNNSDDTYYQLLAKALQEYIATYEEEQQLHQQQQNDHTTLFKYISSWIIGRRIATLRNTLSLSLTSKNDDDDDDDDDDDANDNVNNQNDNTQSRLIKKHLPYFSNKKCYWNPYSIYQRPPYYIHYRTFIQNQDLLHKTTSTTQENNWNVYDTPILQRQYHPLWCQQLENQIDIIQTELDQLLKLNNNNNNKINDNHDHTSIPKHWNQVGDGIHRNGTGVHDSTVIRCGDWREYVLFSSHCNNNNTASGINTTFNHTMNNHTIGSHTKQLIQQYCYNDVVSLVETGIGEVIFSILAPKTHILPHTSSHNIRYTAHLPLRVPTKTTSTTTTNTTTSSSEIQEKPNCYIRIGEEICEWEVGKMLLFDDSYEHEVVNDSNEIRIVLLIRFWHPLLHDPIDRQNAIRYIEQLQNIDQLERYNPPILFMDNNDNRHNYNKAIIQKRRMEQSYCKYCQQTGYTSLRVIAQQRTIVCSCGNLID